MPRLRVRPVSPAAPAGARHAPAAVAVLQVPLRRALQPLAARRVQPVLLQEKGVHKGVAYLHIVPRPGDQHLAARAGRGGGGARGRAAPPSASGKQRGALQDWAGAEGAHSAGEQAAVSSSRVTRLAVGRRPCPASSAAPRRLPWRPPRGVACYGRCSWLLLRWPASCRRTRGGTTTPCWVLRGAPTRPPSRKTTTSWRCACPGRLTGSGL